MVLLRKGEVNGPLWLGWLRREPKLRANDTFQFLLCSPMRNGISAHPRIDCPSRAIVPGPKLRLLNGTSISAASRVNVAELEKNVENA